MAAVTEEVTLAPLSAIPLGEGRTFEVQGEQIAVFRTREGEVFAVQAECPHKGGPLADGLVGGSTVICPLHAWKFDLKTGLPLMGTCALRTFPGTRRCLGTNPAQHRARPRTSNHQCLRTRVKIASTWRNWRSSENVSVSFSRERCCAIAGSASIAARKSDSSSHARIACACTMP